MAWGEVGGTTPIYDADGGYIGRAGSSFGYTPDSYEDILTKTRNEFGDRSNFDAILREQLKAHAMGALLGPGTTNRQTGMYTDALNQLFASDPRWAQTFTDPNELYGRGNEIITEQVAQDSGARDGDGAFSFLNNIMNSPMAPLLLAGWGVGAAGAAGFGASGLAGGAPSGASGGIFDPTGGTYGGGVSYAPWAAPAGPNTSLMEALLGGSNAGGLGASTVPGFEWSPGMSVGTPTPSMGSWSADDLGVMREAFQTQMPQQGPSWLQDVMRMSSETGMAPGQLIEGSGALQPQNIFEGINSTGPLDSAIPDWGRQTFGEPLYQGPQSIAEMGQAATGGDLGMTGNNFLDASLTNGASLPEGGPWSFDGSGNFAPNPTDWKKMIGKFAPDVVRMLMSRNSDKALGALGDDTRSFLQSLQKNQFPFHQFYQKALDYSDPSKRMQMLQNTPGYKESMAYATEAAKRNMARKGYTNTGSTNHVVGVGDLVAKNAQAWDDQLHKQIQAESGMGFAPGTGAQAGIQGLGNLYNATQNNNMDKGRMWTDIAMKGVNSFLPKIFESLG